MFLLFGGWVVRVGWVPRWGWGREEGALECRCSPCICGEDWLSCRWMLSCRLFGSNKSAQSQVFHDVVRRHCRLESHKPFYRRVARIKCLFFLCRSLKWNLRYSAQRLSCTAGRPGCPKTSSPSELPLSRTDPWRCRVVDMPAAWQCSGHARCHLAGLFSSV